MAEKLKDTGNEAFKRGEYQEALRLYRRALEAVRPDESAQLLPAIHNNCAITHLKLAQWKDAVASASIALSSEPRNEKALHRRAQAYVALNNISAALVDARAAAQMKDSMPEVLALYRALAQQDRRIVRGFNPRKSLPRTRPSTLSRVYEYRPLGYDPICNIFAGDAENAIPPIALHEQEEMFGYFGGAADGRHFFTTISLLGSELTKAKANGRISTTRVRLYINDINPAAIVRLIVLLVALDRLAQCADLDNAAKDPRTADPETASAAFLLTNLFIGGGIYEEQHRAATGILQAFVADPRKSLPKWLTLGPNGLKDITDAASAMLKSTRAWGSEIPRLRSYFEQANNAHAKAEKAAGPQAQENVVASFFADSLQLNDSDINERFAHVEAKNAEERRAKLTQFRKIALSLPRQALSVAEALPGLLTDLHSWVQNYRLSPPQQLSALEKQRLYLNPTLLDERWLSRGGNIEGFPRPDVLLSLTEDVREDPKTRRPLMQYDLCADVVALAFCRAALGLRRFLRGDRAPELQVILRVGDLAADLDELHREGVLCDRILANNVGDYAGLMPILTSSSRILRPSKGKASLRTNILLAPSAWTSTEHYIYEYCRLRAAEVRTLLHLQPKVSDVWKDMVFATVEACECGAAAPEQVYEWLAGLFLAIVRPAQRQRQAVRVLSPSSMAVWFVAAEQARVRHGDAAVVKVLRDLLSNQLTTRHRYPASVPEKAPTKKKPAPEMQNVRPYLSELRALSVLWMLPTLANNVISDLDLAALRIARNSLALKVECHLPLPPEWRDDFACGEPSNFSLGLVIFTGPTAAALERSFPHSLLNGEEGVEAFSVLHWDSPKHVAKIWLTVEDFVRLTRAEGQGRVRLFHSDSYTFVGPQWLDVHALVAHDRKAGDLPPSQADAPQDKARSAAAPAAAAAAALPPVVPAAAAAAAVTALPVVEKKAAKPRSDSPPALWEPPAAVAAAAAATRPTSPVLPAVSPAPLYANAAVAGAPPASFAAYAASANFAAVSVTSGAMQPATAVAIAPITADEPFEPFMSHAALAPKPAQEKPGSAERVAELEAQVRQLSMQLDLAKADAAAANARASRHEAEIARMKEERRNEEEAWQGDKRGGGGGGGKGRGRGRK